MELSEILLWPLVPFIYAGFGYTLPLRALDVSVGVQFAVLCAAFSPVLVIVWRSSGIAQWVGAAVVAVALLSGLAGLSIEAKPPSYDPHINTVVNDGFEPHNFAKVREGMTKQEVRELIGEPMPPPRLYFSSSKWVVGGLPSIATYPTYTVRFDSDGLVVSSEVRTVEGTYHPELDQHVVGVYPDGFDPKRFTQIETGMTVSEVESLVGAAAFESNTAYYARRGDSWIGYGNMEYQLQFGGGKVNLIRSWMQID